MGNNRQQSAGEEIANAVTHGIGVVASIAALPVLIVSAAAQGARSVAAAVAFGVTLLLLYVCSTCYHALRESRAKRVFCRLDHAAIYLLIAGTYTPFTLGPLYGAWGWTLFGIIWGLALLGIALRLLGGRLSQQLGVGLYVVMGWLLLVFGRLAFERIPSAGLGWLLAGGLLYTGGLWFYFRDERPYRHSAWHVSVLGGSICHFFAVLWYAS